MATTAATAANRLALVINQMDDVADVWADSRTGAVHLAFYDAYDSQLLMDKLNVSTPDKISANATVVDARLTSLHLSFADASAASWFASIVDLANIDFPRY